MTETRKQFHEELDELAQAVIRAAAMATEAIPRATSVLLGNDLEGAQSLIEHDDDLDEASLENEEQAIRLMALQQPMAGDLRRIVTALKLNGEIERSGDLAVNITKASRRIYGVEFTPKLRGLIEAMSVEAARLLRLAIDAYADGDAGLAAALDDMDDRLDGLNKEFVQAIFEAHTDEAIDLQAAVQLALVGRYYERIGDHAVNIGNQTQFMVTGWMPEHTGAARVKARRDAEEHRG
ncbi:MAG: phosphate signaling complex protein PhoU [Acidimicrobiales bacterium]|nr:phosphate signaling complex protein PhoU [Acidimicrobiales bacterium]